MLITARYQLILPGLTFYRPHVFVIAIALTTNSHFSGANFVDPFSRARSATNSSFPAVRVQVFPKTVSPLVKRPLSSRYVDKKTF